MTFSRLILTAALLTIVPLLSAQAQESCGEPIRMRMLSPEAEKYCSVYDRQLAYREERLKFRKILEERREDFIAPQLAARKKYEKDLEALNNERNHDNDIVAK